MTPHREDTTTIAAATTTTIAVTTPASSVWTSVDHPNVNDGSGAGSWVVDA